MLTIIRKELLEKLVDARFFILLLLFVIVSLFITFVRLEKHNAQSEQYHLNVDLHSKQIGAPVEGGDKFDNLSAGGITVDLPPSEISLLFAGIYDGMAKTYWLTESQDPISDTSLLSTQERFFSPAFDFGLAIAYLISLTAIFLCYDGINGEKERGVLKLILSNRISKAVVIGGKFIGNLIIISIPLTLSFILALVIVNLYGKTSFSKGDWLVLAVIYISGVIFIAVFIALSLLVSLLVNKPYLSLLVLLILWVIFGFVAPSLSPYLAQSVRPLPTTREMEAQKHYVMTRWMSFPRRVKELTGQGYSEEEAKKRVREYYRLGMYEEIIENFQKINKAYKLKVEAQTGLAQNISHISPVSLFLYISSNLSESGIEMKEHFEQSLEEYYQRYSSYLMKKRRERLEDARNGRRPNDDISDRPVFNYAPLSLKERLKKNLYDIFYLISFGLVLFISSYVSFVRYDVR